MKALLVVLSMFVAVASMATEPVISKTSGGGFMMAEWGGTETCNVYVNRAPQKPSGMKMRWGDNKGALISELGDLQDLRKHLNWSTGKPDLVDYNKALQERMNYFAQKVEDDK